MPKSDNNDPENIFFKYGPGKEVDKFLDNPSADQRNEVSNLTKTSIEFILVRVKETPLEKVHSRLKQVVEIALEWEARVDTVMSSLVLITYDNLIEDAGAAQKRRKLVWDLKEQLAEEVAILHGSCWGLKGNINSGQMICYSATLPNFSDLLLELGKLRLNGEKEMNLS